MNGSSSYHLKPEVRLRGPKETEKEAKDSPLFLCYSGKDGKNEKLDREKQNTFNRVSGGDFFATCRKVTKASTAAITQRQTPGNEIVAFFYCRSFLKSEA